MDTLDDLEKACNALLEVALQTKVGAVTIPDDPLISKIEFAQEFKMWKEHEDRLKAEIAEYEAAIIKKGHLPNEEFSEEVWTSNRINDLEERVVKHQAELYAEANKNQRDEIILQRIISTPAVLESLYGESHNIISPTPTQTRNKNNNNNNNNKNNHENDENNENDDDDNFNNNNNDTLGSLTREAMIARDYKFPSLRTKISRLTQAQENIGEARARSRALAVENRDLWARVDRLQKNLKKKEEEGYDSDTATKERDQKLLKNNATILKGVLHALVLESGVNWAKDPELRDFMLTME